MSPVTRRIVIPLIATAAAFGAILALTGAAPAATAAAAGPAQATPPPEQSSGAPGEDAQRPPGSEGQGESATTPAEEQPATGESPIAEAPPVDPFLTGLHAVAPEEGVSGPNPTLQWPSIGSLDPDDAKIRVEFSLAGAGIAHLPLADIWETVEAKHQAEAFRAGKSTTPPDEAMRYVVQNSPLLKNQYRRGTDIPTLAAKEIYINGQGVPIFHYNVDAAGQPTSYVWAETGEGQFETIIRNEHGDDIVRIVRRFTLGDDYDITISNQIINLTDRELTVTFWQYGPDSLRVDRARYMDRRRFRFGYLPDPALFPARDEVYARDNDLLFERNDVLKRWNRAEDAHQIGDAAAQLEHLTLWPNETSREKNYELAWFGATNRYFALAVHPVLDENGAGEKSLESIVQRILIEVSDPDYGTLANSDKSKFIVFTYLASRPATIAPGEELALDLWLYAGPLDRLILDEKQPYASLKMGKLILYQMSACCAVCTFQWLAHILLLFLSILEKYVVGDWAISIIILVIIVRTFLHPITKKSQISMQRFGKVMGEMKPEIDKLQKKYPNDPKKVQAEQMKMMRERGVNPLQILGCLPMFLQTPIWIALYAMLYFVFDLRQTPAFYGFFQLFGNWSFLADLSAPDRFIALPYQGRLWMIDYSAINVLPLLMGAIFFFQQKYMSPPPSPTMSKEQLQQQRIMKFMMVVMFPVMLYSAPSGLTLYIITSSTIGIFESRYIRRHVKEMDLKPKPKKKTKPKDIQGKAYAAAVKRAEEKRQQKLSGPEKRYKKRR